MSLSTKANKNVALQESMAKCKVQLLSYSSIFLVKFTHPSDAGHHRDDDHLHRCHRAPIQLARKYLEFHPFFEVVVLFNLLQNVLLPNNFNFNSLETVRCCLGYKKSTLLYVR